MPSSNQGLTTGVGYYSFHFVCGCGCGTLSEPILKEQYLRLLNKQWYTEKCAKKNNKEPLFKLSNGIVVNNSEF